MLGLSTIGIVHTLIGLIAVGFGIAAFWQYGEIGTRTRSGLLYVVLTVLTCITGFFLFKHGGFGKPHALGVLTLVVLGAAYGAERRPGRIARYVGVISYSTTFFFHMIPGFTETLTRLPAGAPWAASPEAANLQALIGGVFLLFLIGLALQLRALRRRDLRPLGAVA
ncbi:hypothetical protein DFR29_10253 [Tahibacter aquaticus]|jgi:uncharacterized membrane protein|uniref:DUF2306 domain-containing protein n=1 Tax=Tahibacter aquaticus TaxID=520092 RepID=A0A4R6Z6Q7_9GAMM|nr:hypothetical protein [Tahibacter aquaticus]TDR47394.1 hypothetical protein DFR29_10253 [Tahibacter aquaticus]